MNIRPSKNGALNSTSFADIIAICTINSLPEKEKAPLTPSMSIVYHEEEEVPNPSKRSKFLAACLMDAFSNCHMSRRLQTSSPEAEDHPASDDFEDEQEVVTQNLDEDYICT